VFKRCEPCRIEHSPRVVKPVIAPLPPSRFVPAPREEFDVVWSGKDLLYVYAQKVALEKQGIKRV